MNTSINNNAEFDLDARTATRVDELDRDFTGNDYTCCRDGNVCFSPYAG